MVCNHDDNKSEAKIKRIVYDVIDDYNNQMAAEYHLIKSSDTLLWGKASKLDSLGLVSFIVACEEGITDEFGVELSLADERAISLTQSPFRTIGTLIDYISCLLAECAHG